VFGRIGGILCPYVVRASDLWNPLPLLIFGSLCKILSHNTDIICPDDDIVL